MATGCYTVEAVFGRSSITARHPLPARRHKLVINALLLLALDLEVAR